MWNGVLGAAGQHEAAEQSSFDAARARTDPGARVAALQQFLQQFPSGSRSSAARQLLLDTYLVSLPEQTAPIHALASASVMAAPAGFERWTEEARLAQRLASAGNSGADIEQARLWAQDAVSSLTEESYRREMSAAQVRYKLPRIPQRQMHKQFLEYRASFLTSLAAVDLAQHELDRASPLLVEAFRLEPMSGEVNLLRGELAFAQGDTRTALQEFERADALGALPEPWRVRELQLFTGLEHGNRQDLDFQVDEVYRHLFPAPYALPARQIATGGHTVLLELFTGSGCAPCAGPDLAVDSLLGSYRREDLAVLAFDEHIPRPDPLANPDSIKRAATYGVGNTPAAFLDGQPLEVLGASRDDVENIVIGFADQIEEEAALPSRLGLELEITQDPGGIVQALPTLTVRQAPSAQADITTGDVSLRKLAQAVLYVALVQDHVRYSGENGVRLHRMVVRSVRQLPAAGYLNGAVHAEPVLFDPAELDQKQEAYLTGYEHHNDRFGAFQFVTKHLPISGGDLAVVVWVQDPVSRQVLQATYAAVGSK